MDQRDPGVQVAPNLEQAAGVRGDDGIRVGGVDLGGLAPAQLLGGSGLHEVADPRGVHVAEVHPLDAAGQHADTRGRGRCCVLAV